MLFSRVDSFLVCVRSSWFVGEADVARIALAEHGIPCHVENEHFHMWHWLYANISGGFKVMVPREYAEQAARILLDGKNSTASDALRPSWRCPECGREMEGDWNVCWCCTTSRDGRTPTEPGERTALASALETEVDASVLAQTQAAAIVLTLVLFFWMTGGSLGAVVIGAVAVFVGFHLQEKKRQPSVDAPGEDLHEAERCSMTEPLTPEEQSYQRRVRMGNRIAERALMSAIMGVAWFPPLVILAGALLWRLDPRKTPPGPLHRQQVRLTWCLCAFGLLVTAICIGQLIGTTGDAVGLMGKW